MARIHHTQIKQAAKLGITLSLGVDGGFVIASKGGKQVSADDAKSAIAALLAQTGTTTADVMKSLKPKAAKKAKAVKSKKPKFKCENEECRSTKRESDGEGGFVCSECGEDATMEGDENGASVVKKLYKARYKPHKAKCGDQISQLITAHITVKAAEKGERPHVDEAKLIRFAKANGCWDPNYAKINVGMKRMNIANRLRGKVRRDKHVVVWPN